MSPDPTDQPGRPPDPRDLELARAAVQVPAVFLILNGLLGLALVGLVAVPLVFDPDSMLNFFHDVAAKQPAGPEKQEFEQNLAAFEAEVNQDRDRFVRRNAITLSVRAVLDLLSIVGGFSMRALSGYRMSVVGGAVAVIPLATGCCVTGIPFGIWALVVLSRPDVKAAFAAKRTAPPPDPDARQEELTTAMLDFDKAGGLVPAVAQDADTGEVLMLAWMNREAFDETVRTGRAVYFSRSRNKLWRKGEESGHVQEVVGVYVDCDADTVLLKVRQVGGAACHEGYKSCFFRRLDGAELTVVGERVFDPKKVYKN